MKTFATIILELERMDANMSSKPKYSIGEIVKIKATGEKVKINDWYCNTDKIWYDVDTINNGYFFGSYFESELKPYRPSRTGKHRDSNGRFYKPWYIKREFISMDEMLGNTDSKQRNYQRILSEMIFIHSKLDVIENKIDELGRKV